MMTDNQYFRLQKMFSWALKKLAQEDSCVQFYQHEVINAAISATDSVAEEGFYRHIRHIDGTDSYKCANLNK